MKKKKDLNNGNLKTAGGIVLSLALAGIAAYIFKQATKKSKSHDKKDKKE